jgi:hypothetical protein
MSKSVTVRKRKKRRGGADDDRKGPQQLLLASIQNVANAGYELAELVLEREKLEEAKLIQARRHRARIKELDTQIKELSVALNARKDGGAVAVKEALEELAADQDDAADDNEGEAPADTPAADKKTDAA